VSKLDARVKPAHDAESDDADWTISPNRNKIKIQSKNLMS
jgi:hypothetical protein